MEVILRAVLLEARKARVRELRGSDERKRLGSVVVCLEDALDRLRGGE